MKIEIIDNINKFSDIESKWNKIYDIGIYFFVISLIFMPGKIYYLKIVLIIKYHISLS